MINYSTFDNTNDPLPPLAVSADIQPNARYVACIFATHDFEISLNGGPWATFKSRRDLLATQTITSLKVKNPDPVNNLVVDFVFSDGQVKINLQNVSVDNLPAIQNVDIQNWPVNPIQGTFVPEIFNTLTSLADVAIVAADPAVIVSVAVATKRETIIKNPSSNTASIRVGGATTAAAVGLELGTGESITLTGSMAIYVYSATAQNISICEVHKV